MSALADLLRYDAATHTAWMRVGELSANDEACETCPHLQLERDGDAVFEECTLGRQPAASPSDCAAYRLRFALDPTDRSICR